MASLWLCELHYLLLGVIQSAGYLRKSTLWHRAGLLEAPLTMVQSIRVVPSGLLDWTVSSYGMEEVSLLSCSACLLEQHERFLPIRFSD